MALTQSRPENPAPTRARTDDPRSGGLAGVLGSGDHKVIGRLFIGAALLFLIASEALGAIVDVDVISPGRHKLGFVNDGNLLSFASSHLTGVVYAGLVPLFLGLALVVVPLQVGARAVAFPRAAAAGFWTWLTGVGFVAVAYGIGGGPTGSRATGFDLWALGLIVALAGLALTTVCIVTTVFTLRAPGMRLTRVPLFSWSMLVAGTIWLVTLPVLAALLLIVFVDHHNGGVFTGSAGTGEPFGQVIWSLRAPQLYAFVAPVLGIVGDIVPTIARARNDFRHQAAQGFIALFAILGFGAYTASSLSKSLSTTASYHNPVVIVAMILIVLPVLALAGMWADSFRRGREAGKPQLSSVLVFTGIVLVLLLLAVVVGALDPIQRLKLHETLYTDGHYDLVTGLGVLGALAGLTYWSTKIIGRRLVDVGAIAVGTLALLGTLGLAAGEILSGAFGKHAEKTVGSKTYNFITALGAGALVVALLLLVVNVLVSLRSGDAPDDPYDGFTLEWATSSPPATDNFAEVLPVGSEAPLLDLRTTEVAG